MGAVTIPSTADKKPIFPRTVANRDPICDFSRRVIAVSLCRSADCTTADIDTEEGLRALPESYNAHYGMCIMWSLEIEERLAFKNTFASGSSGPPERKKFIKEQYAGGGVRALQFVLVSHT